MKGETVTMFEPGDHVVVPWGVDWFDGIVKRVVQWKQRTSVDVVIHLPENEEPEAVNYALSVVARPEEFEGEHRELAAWVYRRRYEAAVDAAVRRVLESFPMRSDPDDEFDGVSQPAIEIHLSDNRSILLVPRRVEWVTTLMVERAVERIRGFRGRETAGAPLLGLIVFDEEIGPDVQEPPPDDDAAGPERFVTTTWRGPEDDGRLGEALSMLLG